MNVLDQQIQLWTTFKLPLIKSFDEEVAALCKSNLETLMKNEFRGVYDCGTPQEELAYHLGFGVSRTHLLYALKTMKTWFWKTHKSIDQKTTRAMNMGDALHKAILEPHMLDDCYVSDAKVIEEIHQAAHDEAIAAKVRLEETTKTLKIQEEKLAQWVATMGREEKPSKDLTKKMKEQEKITIACRKDLAKAEKEAAKDFTVKVPALTGQYKAAKEVYSQEGKTLIPAEDWNNVRAMVDEVYAHPRVKNILKAGYAEKMVYGLDPETGLCCKVKPDWLMDDLMVDIKTTNDAEDFACSKKIWDFRYDVQAIFYPAVAKWAGLPVVDAFPLIFVEKEPPYEINVLDPWQDAGLVDVATSTMHTALNRIAYAIQDNDFPGYPTTIRPVGLPPWAFYKE